MRAASLQKTVVAIEVMLRKLSNIEKQGKQILLTSDLTVACMRQVHDFEECNIFHMTITVRLRDERLDLKIFLIIYETDYSGLRQILINFTLLHSVLDDKKMKFNVN